MDHQERAELLESSWYPELKRLELIWARDEDLRLALRFSEAEYVNVSDSWITDEGVSVLAKFPKLSGLAASSTNVSGETFGAFSDHECLEDLVLFESPVTDRDTVPFFL